MRIHPSGELKAISGCRRGAVSLYFLLTLPVLLVAIALILYSTQLLRTRTDMQKSADAAALAGALTLVDDLMLTGDRDAILKLIDAARREAQLYAAENAVMGESLELDLNLANDPEGDIAVGALSSPRSRDWIHADLNGPDADWTDWINSIRITGRRTRERGNAQQLNDGPLLSTTPTDVIVAATAFLDRHVIGIRPLDQKPVPLAPFALLSALSEDRPEAWEAQVERRQGSDSWRYFPETRKVLPDAAGDRIHEMTVRLRCSASSEKKEGESKDKEVPQPQPNACLLQIGVRDFSGLCQQLNSGMVREHLSEFGGRFALGANHELVVPGSPRGPGQNTKEFALLLKTLQYLQMLAEPRVWPLFSRFDEGTTSPVITGFVAARVVHVYGATDEGDLVFVLQPCMLSLPSIITEVPRPEREGGPLVNRYLCKVRLVE